MKLLYIGSHSILEYDELRLFADQGIDVFSIGAYSDPAHPSDDKRPPLDLPYYADLDAACREQRERHAGEDWRYIIDPAKSDLHPTVLEWADVIVVAAFPDAWIVPQWRKLRDKRVIWRTIGQSDPTTETYLTACRKDGLGIVRYSPAEERAFAPYGYAGHDEIIRFGKYPSDYGPWIGDEPVVGNVTQDMAGRGEACGYSFWMEATRGLPTKPAGPNSQALPGGIGPLSPEALTEYLRHLRAYLYTGTQPASYTLGLMEAMLTGVPVVSIGPNHFGLPALFEGHEIVGWGFDEPSKAREWVERYLKSPSLGHTDSPLIRGRAAFLFGADTIGPQWAAHLGVPALVAA